MLLVRNARGNSIRVSLFGSETIPLNEGALRPFELDIEAGGLFDRGIQPLWLEM